MKKYFCDRCGEEVTEHSKCIFRVLIPRFCFEPVVMEQDFHLCPVCVEDFRDFLVQKTSPLVESEVGKRKESENGKY